MSNPKTTNIARTIVIAVALAMMMPAIAEAKIHRSRAAVIAFKKAHPCPANGATKGACPGFIVDHVKALACGGADAPSNMQWQTAAEAAAKDKWERIGCDTKQSSKVTSNARRGV